MEREPGPEVIGHICTVNELGVIFRKYSRRILRVHVNSNMFLFLEVIVSLYANLQAWLCYMAFFQLSELGYLDFENNKNIPKTYSWMLVHELFLAELNPNMHSPACLNITGNDTSTLVAQLKHCDDFNGPPWFLNFIRPHIFQLLGILATTIFLRSYKCRQTGFRYAVLAALFFCMFSDFFSIGALIGRNTGSAPQQLATDMNNDLLRSHLPEYVPLLLDDTQTYRKCCGLQSYRDWSSLSHNGTLENYPRSCCDYEKRNCSMKMLTHNDVWIQGCQELEADKLRTAGRILIIAWGLKLVVNVLIIMGIFQIIYLDVTPLAACVNASVEMNGIFVYSRGNLIITGMRDRNVISVKVQNFNRKRCTIGVFRSDVDIVVRMKRGTIQLGSVSVIAKTERGYSLLPYVEVNEEFQNTKVFTVILPNIDALPE